MRVNREQMTVRLFIRSSRIRVATGHRGYDTVDYPAANGQYTLGPEDANANERLNSEGIKFEIVDISRGILPRIQATLRRITQTPTLVDEDIPARRYVGTIGIFEYIESKREDYRKSAHRSTPRNWNV